jgi:hypothetical protein
LVVAGNCVGNGNGKPTLNVGGVSDFWSLGSGAGFEICPALKVGSEELSFADEMLAAVFVPDVVFASPCPLACPLDGGGFGGADPLV